MKYEEIKNAIHSIHAGTYTTIETCKTLKTKKAYTDKSIMKVSRMTGRFGVDYNHISKVQEKRASGELPKEPQKLPWGNWMKDEEGYLIEHKGKVYVRVATSPNKTKSTYLVNGVPTDEDTVKSMCLASEFHKGEKPDVMTISASNIVRIG